MAELGGRQLCTFDPVGEFYAAVSSDNRLRTWTTVSHCLSPLLELGKRAALELANILHRVCVFRSQKMANTAVLVVP